MNVLVLSHSCVTPVNQAAFASLEEETGWTVGIVAPEIWRTEYGTIRRLERGAGFSGPLYGLPVMFSGNIPLHFYRRGLHRVLMEFKPDVIYAHHEPYGAATAQLYRTNLKTVNKPIGFFTWQNLNKRYPPPFRQTERWVYRNSTFAISGSESAREVLHEKGFERAVAVVPPGIDVRCYQEDEAAGEIRKRLLGSDEELLIGFVGRVAEEKGLDTLLDALAQLEGIRWRLVVVGSGPHDEAFASKADQLGLTARITREGYVPHDDAPAYLAACDVIVLPSETRANWKEQFGRVLIEAAAAGTAVIGSSSGEIPNVILSTGGGLIFSEGDHVALASCLMRLLGDEALREELASNGRTSVLASYTNEAVALKLAGALEMAVSGMPPVLTSETESVPGKIVTVVQPDLT